MGDVVVSVKREGTLPKIYGPFESSEDATAWRRENLSVGERASAYIQPLNSPGGDDD